MLVINVMKNLEVYQVDFKRAFLNKDLDEVIFMEQLDGKVFKGHKELAYKLQKSLYGLK
jgi:hypothetical protein